MWLPGRFLGGVESRCLSRIKLLERRNFLRRLFLVSECDEYDECVLEACFRRFLGGLEPRSSEWGDLASCRGLRCRESLAPDRLSFLSMSAPLPSLLRAGVPAAASAGRTWLPSLISAEVAVPAALASASASAPFAAGGSPSGSGPSSGASSGEYSLSVVGSVSLPL